MPVAIKKIYCRWIERNAAVIRIVIGIIIIAGVITAIQAQHGKEHGQQKRYAQKRYAVRHFPHDVHSFSLSL